MKGIFIAAGMITCLAAYSQNVSVPGGYEATENLRDLGTSTRYGNVRTFDNRYEGVKGTPYVFENWLPGEVFMNNKRKTTIRELNYNCFDNEIVFLDPATGTPRILNKYLVDLFQIKAGSGTITFVPVILKDGEDPVFAQVLYNQGSMMYKVYGKDFLKADYEGAYSADRKYDQFVDKSDLYFLKKGDHVLYKVRKSKRYMTECFSDKEKEVSRYIKSEKLKFKDEQDLVQLLTYYDTLLENPE
jgi:hypothetical protein